MTFWSAAAVGYGYMTQILEYKGFSGVEIGILNAIKLLSTVFFQIVISSISDKYAKRIPLKWTLFILTGFATACTIMFYKIPMDLAQMIILNVGFGASFTCISPLIDALSALYVSHGVQVNYAFCRAGGSMAWAIASVACGVFCDRYGADNLLIIECIFLTGILLILLWMDRIHMKEDITISPYEKNKNEDEMQNKKPHTVWYLLVKYPKYSWFLIGSCIMFMGYDFGTTFLIHVIENQGGNNFDYGIAEFVMAISEIPAAFIIAKSRRKIPTDRMMFCCATFMTLKNILATYGGLFSIIIFSQSCEMLGFGLFYAGSVYLVEDMLPQQDIVKGVTCISAATLGIGEGIASFASGIIKSIWGISGLMKISTVVSGISIICMFVMCSYSYETGSCNSVINSDSSIVS